MNNPGYISDCTAPVLLTEEPPELEHLGVVRQGSVTLRCYPNPFRGRMTVEYELPETGPIFLAVTDLNGRVMQVLENGVEQEAGRYRRVVDSDDLRAGIYLLTLRTGKLRLTEKLVLLR